MSEDTLYESTFAASLLEHEDAAPQNPAGTPTLGENDLAAVWLEGKAREPSPVRRGQGGV